MAANLKMIAVLKQADNYLSIPVLVLSLLVLVLSWKVSSKSLSRVYCINIAVPSFICNLLFIGLKVANTMKPEITKPDNAFYKYYMGLVSFYAFCRSFTLNGYLYFSTLTVCLAYVGYVRPILFYALFNSRKITLMFVMCYVWTTFSIALQFSRFFLSGALNLIPEKFNFGPLMWLHVSVALICYGVMLIAYVLTVVELKKPSVGDVRTNAVNMSAQKRWRTLKSVLIYCTPPNLIVAAALGGYICDSVVETQGLFDERNWQSEEEMRKWFAAGDYCGDIRVWTQTSTNIRLFVSSFTAIIAFHEYRQAFLKTFAVFCRKMPEPLVPKSILYEFAESRLFQKSNVLLPSNVSTARSREG